ncbi:MAG: hypothetical protein ACP5G1_04750, partial [Nanopusillaceae archaeon]
GNTNYFGITSRTPVVSNTNYYTTYTSLSTGYTFVLLSVGSSSSSSTIAYLTYVPGYITGSYQDLYWLFISAYPPNGVMPHIIISQTSSGAITNISWYPILIKNNQSSPTPSPFQQDIAICNGTANLGSDFAYINNATLFNQINNDGSNVLFYNNSLLYSWYEGQENISGVYCDVWWIKLSNGIPANSYITTYMYVGNLSQNFYSQYYPYVGAPRQVLGTSQYDNGNYVFNYYQNWGGLTSLPSGWNNLDSVSVTYSTNYTQYTQTSANNWYYGLYGYLPSSIAGSSFLLGTYVYSY